MSNVTTDLTTDSTTDEDFTASDATWVITSSIIIFTMQTGFGLLESGCVSAKNEVNILMKNAADVILGGLTYWMFGYGLQFGKGPLTTAFSGAGSFLMDDTSEEMGASFSSFIFQMSFATTATTIVSGAMAERTNYNAYCIFSFLNTIVYCVPAGWVWGDHGFLKKLGAIDFAGSGCVHLLGGVSALVAAIMLGPRTGRFSKNFDTSMGNPTNVIQGTFTLWWGWLVFNCGSAFGVTNNRWMYAARAAVTTFNASVGGGIVGILLSYAVNRRCDVGDLMNAILASLVAITAGAAYYNAWEAIIVGIIGALVSFKVPALMELAKIDDPVSAVAVHGVSGIWGLLAVGLFITADETLHWSSGNAGVFKGGGFYLLGVQTATALCIIGWSAATTYILLKLVDYIIPIRMHYAEEVLGADYVEHGVRHDSYNFDEMLQFLKDQNHNVSKFAPAESRAQWDLFILKRYLENPECFDRQNHPTLLLYVKRFSRKYCSIM